MAHAHIQQSNRRKFHYGSASPMSSCHEHASIVSLTLVTNFLQFYSDERAASGKVIFYTSRERGEETYSNAAQLAAYLNEPPSGQDGANAFECHGACPMVVYEPLF